MQAYMINIHYTVYHIVHVCVGVRVGLHTFHAWRAHDAQCVWVFHAGRPHSPPLTLCGRSLARWGVRRSRSRSDGLLKSLLKRDVLRSLPSRHTPLLCSGTQLDSFTQHEERQTDGRVKFGGSLAERYELQRVVEWFRCLRGSCLHQETQLVLERRRSNLGIFTARV